MGIRLFASDLDGTLLNSSHMISDRSARIIQSTQKEGKIFLVVTGRAWSSTLPILHTAGISCGAVLLNGAEFRLSDGSVIFRENIEEMAARKIMEILGEHHIDFEMHTNAGNYATDTRLWPDAKQLYRDRNGNCCESQKSGQEERKSIRALKFYMVCHNLSLLAFLRQEFEILPELYIASSAPWNLEITAAAATKDQMLDRVAAWYGILPEEAAVFGDGENDIPMLRYFPHSYAVGNAPASIKKNAAHIIKTNEEDGVACQMEWIAYCDGQTM